MLKKAWIPVFPALGAALLLASCAAGDPAAEVTEDEPASSARESEEVAAVVAGGGEEVLPLGCEDDEALAAKAAHNDGAEPIGWPQDWDGTGTMPDPLCHPDYLQIDEWEDLEAHSACWEGNETSTLVRTGQSQEAVDKQLWLQSQARADWEQNPAGGTCAEQWAANDG
ncbi:hypothetical protein ACHABQ_00040 [Nesterenkonia aurantiaca]|uniref:hypothetical protein n=1 Tax=Nesterenkonia aurantiaca TaxID=1436010 RepID=UPI003EE4A52D